MWDKNERCVTMIILNKEHWLRLQKLVVASSPDTLVFSKSKLKQMAVLRADQSLKIVQDCIRLINTTNKPDVYFKRFDILKEKMDELVALEPFVKFKNPKPSNERNKILLNEQNSIKDFLERYTFTTRTKLDSLKNDKAIERQCHLYFDNIELYLEYMNESNSRFVQEQYENFLATYTETDAVQASPTTDLIDNNINGERLEKLGKLNEAIALYEYNISQRFDGNFPYDRLAIIYRKQKKYDEEIRVLKQAIDVFTHDISEMRPDRDIKLEKFEDRLKKATNLLNKN